MINIKNIHKSYTNGQNNLHVLKGIDLNIKAGEMISIMGPSGSGKSTLLNILGILDNYDDGIYQLDGKKIQHLNERKAAQLRNKTLGFVFQSFNLVSFKNAMENVALPLYYQKISRRKRNRIAVEYLDKLGLKEWAHHLPSELSGGQKQRVAVARALITKPKVILADEPTGALDSVTSQEMMDLLTEINKTGITMIIVTHELDIARRTQRTIRIIDGTIREIVDNRVQHMNNEERMDVKTRKPEAQAKVGDTKYEKVA
ncbi:MAG: ABC transporter ATP-binding protein [Bacteroidetes bacterium]|nr:ABC transporter ATP-binding protein [Bacteroidota bacterium]